MDALSSIFSWLSEHEAGISAVVGIAVLVGILFAGLRFPLRELKRVPSTGNPANLGEVRRERRRRAK